MKDTIKLIVGLMDARKPKKTPTMEFEAPKKRIAVRPLSYTERHRGQWFRPEYNLAEIQIAQDVDSYLFRAIQKKVNRFMIAGYEFHGPNPDTVKYIKRRISEIEFVSNMPWAQLLRDTVQDLFRFSNCMWVKVRDQEGSTGDVRVDLNGIELDPVAAYFILPFETLEFKTKPNGEIRKVLQKMPTGETREYLPRDLVHFYVNKKPGFCIGTPEMLPVLDDLSLLRRIEELVEELIETNLFPNYHYKIGTDELPERTGPDGVKESDVVKRKVEYMPAGGMFITDHRHQLEVLGSESKALRIDFYLSYFKNRAFAGMGISSVDMGEGDTANRSTAGTLSKSLIQDVEAMQEVMKTFLEFFVVQELMLEGGFDPLDEEERVEIKFGVIDREEQTKLENQALQLVHGNLFTTTEGRQRLGRRAYKEEDMGDTYHKKFEEPLALLKGMGPGSAASQTLAENESSNVSPEAVKHEEKFAEKQAKEAAKAKAAQAKKTGRPASKTSGSGTRKSSSSKSRPSNQSGTRSSPKFSRDERVEALLDSEALAAYDAELDRLNALLHRRVGETNCSPEIVYANLSYRLRDLNSSFLNRLGLTDVD